MTSRGLVGWHPGLKKPSFNFAWSALFYGVRSPALALVDIGLLRVSFASVPNFAIWRLNA